MKKVGYQIAGMELARFSLPVMEMNVDLQGKPLSVNTRVNFAFGETANVLRCKLSVDLVQSRAPLLQTELLMFFKIKDESIDELKQGDSVVVPRSALCQFASFCYGALRGIMYVKTMNTPIEKVCLPPMDMKNLITEDIAFPLHHDE